MSTDSDSEISTSMYNPAAGQARADLGHISHDLQTMEVHGPSLSDVCGTKSLTDGTESGSISIGIDQSNKSSCASMNESSATISTSKAMCVGSADDDRFTIVSSTNKDTVMDDGETIDGAASDYSGYCRSDMIPSRRTDYNGGECLPSSQLKLKQLNDSRMNKNSTTTLKTYFEIELLRKKLSSLQTLYQIEKDLLSERELQRLRRERIEFTSIERNDFSCEKDYLRALINGVQKEIDYCSALKRDSETVSEINFHKLSKVKTEYNKNNSRESESPVSVSNVAIANNDRRMPSFGNEREYLSRMRQLEERNRVHEERIISLQNMLYSQTIDLPRNITPLELSQGRDVSDSQEQRLLQAIANESGDENKLHDSVNSNSSIAAQVSSSLSYQNVSLDDVKYSPASETNSSCSSDRTRSSSVERKSVRIKREPSVSNESSADCDYDSKQMNVTPLKGIRKHSSDEYCTKRSSESSKQSDSDSEKFERRKSRHNSPKEKNVSFRTKRNESGSESEDEQWTPSKDFRKRRHSRPRIIDESDSEQTHTKRSLSQLDKYDGSGSLEVFLRLFDNCSQYYRWSDREKLSQLVGALRGNAAQVLLGGKEVDYSYQSLREELQKCFGNTGQATQYRIMLRSRRRQAKESLQTLYQDVCRLLSLAYPGPRTKLSDDLAVDAFTDSLNDADLQQRVRDRFPSDLAEAYKIALSLEANSAYIHRDSETKRMPPRQFRQDMNARSVQQDASVDERLDMLDDRMQFREKRVKQSELCLAKKTLMSSVLY